MAKLNATPRSEIGSRKVRALRRRGLIPGIIYGHGQTPQPVTVSEHDVEVALLHGERWLEIAVDGKTQNCLIREVQWDIYGQQVLHVDLTRVELDERVEVQVALVLRGTPKGVTDGDGVLQQNLDQVTVECTVRSIPEEIAVPVGQMGVGDSLLLRDVELPEGAQLADDPDTAVCSVTYISEEEVEEEAPAEAAPSEPELVGEQEGETPPPAQPGEEEGQTS